MTDEEILQQIPSFPQTQESTIDQLRLLRLVANKIGCYDAADVLAEYLRSRDKFETEVRKMGLSYLNGGLR